MGTAEGLGGWSRRGHGPGSHRGPTGVSWGLMGSHQGPMGSHRGLMGSHQGLMGSHGVSRGLMGSHGVSWGPTGSPLLICWIAGVSE